jgi:hypothetical protein
VGLLLKVDLINAVASPHPLRAGLARGSRP